MNPYYPNQYQYQSQPIQYGYGQGPYLGYQTPPQPHNQTPNFSAMYTSVQPYNSKEFLLNTFGNRPDFINVFQTLPHQDKLMLYVCTEQKRMYGQIKNKQSYQRLLKDIAQKVQNYNNFHNNKKEPQSREDQKNKELQHKIDDIVERTFEKLNLSNLAHNHSQNHKENKHEEVLLTEQDEDQEEWVEPEEELVQPEQLSPAKIQSQKQPLNAPIFNMFTFDSQIEQALTQEIGLKPATEKKSIWELDLAEEEVKMSEPNLKQIFKSQSSKISVIKQEYKEKQNLFVSPTVYKLESQQLNPPYLQYPQKNLLKIEELGNSHVQSMISGSEQLERLWNSYPKSDHIDQHLTNWDSYGIPIQQESTEKQIIPISRQKQTIILQNMAEIQSIEEVPIIDRRPVQSKENKANKEEKQQFIIEELNEKQASHQLDEKDSKNQQNLAQEIIQSQPLQALNSQSNNQFDFDLLAGFSSTPSQQSVLKVETNLSDINATQSIQPLASVFGMNDLVIQSSEPPQDKLQFRPEVSEMLSPRRLELLPFKIKSQDYNLIEGLKIQLDPKKKQLIQKKLHNKSFECDTQFYLTMMNYLEQISLRFSLQFQHFKEQYLIVKDLHEETKKYTTAVDEDEEETVATSIKRTKDLYRQIYAHSQQTELYTTRILSTDNQEKGFLYKFGKILIDSCISHETLSRVVANEARNQIEESFYVLYVLQKCNTLNSLKVNSEKIIAYANRAYQKYREFDSQIIEELENQMGSYPKYIEYLKGMVRILEICERVIILLKVTCIKPQANVVKTLKNCKDIKTKYGNYRSLGHFQVLLPENYRQALKQGVEKNKSLYDLHAAFSEAYQRNPVCRICLMEVGRDGAKTSEDYCHFSCFNLLAEIEQEERYKQTQ